MERYKKKFKENDNSFKILNKSSLTDDELYDILIDAGHKTITMWKNDRSNLIRYLIDVLKK